MDDIRNLQKPAEKELTKEEFVEVTDAFNAMFGNLHTLPTENFFDDISTEDYVEIINCMRTDYAVKAAIETLKSKMWRPKWFIAAGDETNNRSVEAADFIRNQFFRKSGVFYEQIKKLDLCLEWGKSVNQIIWEEPRLNNGGWYIKRLKNEDQDLFTFDYWGKMRKRVDESILKNELKWITTTHNEELDNENGKSILLAAYWPWHFRNILLKEGINYFKRAVIPAIIAHYKASENDEETARKGAKIAKSLKNLRNSTGVAMSNIESVDVLNIAAKGDEIRNFIDMFDMNISLAITGTKRLFNVENGSRASDETQFELVSEKAQNIMSSEIVPSINLLISYITFINYPELDFNVYPTFNQRWDEKKASADHIVSLMSLGVEMDRDTLVNEYGFPIATEETENAISKEEADQSFSNRRFFFKKK